MRSWRWGHGPVPGHRSGSGEGGSMGTGAGAVGVAGVGREGAGFVSGLVVGVSVPGHMSIPRLVN
jgi:hypothetical protein